MSFSKVFKFITDRPFVMALIVFVVLFIAYNFLFKNKNQTAAATVATAAMPTYGRPTIYNQEFYQYPVTSQPSPPTGNPVPPTQGPPPVANNTITIGSTPGYPNGSTISAYMGIVGISKSTACSLNPWLKCGAGYSNGEYDWNNPGNVDGKTFVIR